MKKIDYKINDFKANVLDFLLLMQTERKIDEIKYSIIYNMLKSFSEDLKGDELVSKELLYETYTMINIMRNEADFFYGDEKDVLIKMSHDLHEIFYLILKNEIIIDREPGVPRII